MNFLWTCEPDGYVEPRVTSSGAASVPPETVIDVFKKCVQKHGDRPALHLKRKGADGVLPTQWKTWTWCQYFDDCRAFGKSLISLNVQNFKVVNILGFNSPEWFIANNGSMFAGCIAAGIYSTNTSEACGYITEHSKAEVIVLEDNKQLAKYTNKAFPHLKAITIWGEDPSPAIVEKISVPVYKWDDFLKLGILVTDSVVDERISKVRPGHCSTLIYTSGTTGPPKAVMISHDNITWIIKTVINNYLDFNFSERLISYLPLSHIAAQIIDIHSPMTEGYSVYFAQPDALKGSLSATMKEVKPTVFFGVPRVWEKIQERMQQIGRETTGVKKILSTWAKGLGAEHSRQIQYGQSGGAPCGYGCASSIVLSKIKAALGLDACKGCFSAAAPIAIETVNYFASLDIPVYEVFGQSESTGPHTFSHAAAWKVGYCGRPVLGTETRIVPSTGEVIYRGRHIFMGYMYMPEQTAETIDNDGFLHSGDIAEFDGNNHPDVPAPSGFMRITGRIKELIITAGGENIPPVLIENEVKAALLAVSNCMLIGDKRKFLSLLVALKCTVDKDTNEPTDILAHDAVFIGNQIGSTATTMTEAAADPLWSKYIENGIKTANSKTTSNAQIIQKWKMLPADFSEKQGDLTPTLKLKRNVVAKKYDALIESLYAGSDDK